MFILRWTISWMCLHTKTMKLLILLKPYLTIKGFLNLYKTQCSCQIKHFAMYEHVFFLSYMFIPGVNKPSSQAEILLSSNHLRWHKPIWTFMIFCTVRMCWWWSNWMQEAINRYILYSPALCALWLLFQFASHECERMKESDSVRKCLLVFSRIIWARSCMAASRLTSAFLQTDPHNGAITGPHRGGLNVLLAGCQKLTKCLCVFGWKCLRLMSSLRLCFSSNLPHPPPLSLSLLSTQCEPCCSTCSERRRRLFVQDPETCLCSCKNSEADCRSRNLELNERNCRCVLI